MPDVLLIDSDILIDFGNGNEIAAEYLNKHQGNFIFGISVITQMELLVGVRNKADLRAWEKLILNFDVFDLNPSICTRAVQLIRSYRLSHGLMIPDAFIAATAIEHGFPLVSKNQRDFHYITRLEFLPLCVACDI